MLGGGPRRVSRHSPLVPRDLPVPHVDHALRRARELLVMGDDDDRRPVRVQAAEEADDFLPGSGVELAGRLVGEEQGRPVGERAGDRHALLLAPGELRRAVALTRPESHVLEQFPRSRAPLGARHLGLGHRQLDVLAGRECRHEIEALEDEPHVPQAKEGRLLVGHRAHVAAAHGHHPTARPVDDADEVEQRALAAPRRADDGDVLPVDDVERDPAHGVHRLAPHAIVAAQVANRDGREEGGGTRDEGRRSGVAGTRMVVRRGRFGATVMLGGTPRRAARAPVHDRPSSLVPRPASLAGHATASRRSVVAIGSDAARHDG